MCRFLESAVDANARWLHDDASHSDCDRANAAAHLRALMVGHSVTIPVSGGELVLGQWQRVLMAELDGPRTRTLRVSIQGIA
jgi:secondary thiamine-phosphate synthase enzyme